MYSSRYRLYGKTLSEVAGSIVPAAITYTKNADGSYVLDEYLEAMDGSYFGKIHKGLQNDANFKKRNKRQLRPYEETVWIIYLSY